MLSTKVGIRFSDLIEDIEELELELRLSKMDTQEVVMLCEKALKNPNERVEILEEIIKEYKDLI